MLPRPLRYLWAAPTTAVGVPFVVLAWVTGGGARVVDGVLEVHGGFVAFFLRRCTLLKGGATAMTLGHIVIARTRECHDVTRAHERVHVRQVERWGPLFLPAYAAASLVALLQRRHPYRDNVFEVEAYTQAP